MTSRNDTSSRDGWLVWDPALGDVREMTDQEWGATLDAAARTTPERPWTSEEHEHYLDSRDQVTDYDPAAEYGDAGWREPTSEREAEQRREHLIAQRDAAPPDPAPEHAGSEVDDALMDAQIAASLSDRAHDGEGPERWAEVRDLEALTALEPLPPREERGETEQEYAARRGLDQPGRIQHALDPEPEPEQDVELEDEEIGA